MEALAADSESEEYSEKCDADGETLRRQWLSCSKQKNKMEEEDKENMNEKRWKSKLNHMLEPVAEGTQLGGPL